MTDFISVLSFNPCCSVTKSHLTFCNLTDCSMPGFPVLHYLPEFAQIHAHWVSDAIRLSHPLLPSSALTFSLLQHRGLSQWIPSLYPEAKVLELQLQHQSFQWIFRVDFLQDWLIWSPCSPRDLSHTTIQLVQFYCSHVKNEKWTFRTVK